MSEHVIPVLRSKRAEFSGHILDLEKRVARFRADLANTDAAIRIMPPAAEPGAIPTKWAHERTKYFAPNELARTALDLMRKVQEPLSARKIFARLLHKEIELHGEDVSGQSFGRENLKAFLGAKMRRHLLRQNKPD
jgi:hypothetical protein